MSPSFSSESPSLSREFDAAEKRALLISAPASLSGRTARPDASIYRPYGQMKTYLVVADLTGPGLVESTAVDECMQVLAQPINGELLLSFSPTDTEAFMELGLVR